MELNVVEAGQGRPLIIMHGLLGSCRNWGGMLKRFGEVRHVHALDLPNHGASPWSEQGDYPFLARSVARHIEEKAGAPAAILGHSMGGKAAMMLALTRPELVERLIVVDIAPVGYTHTFAPYIKAMRGVSLASAGRRSDVERQLADTITDPRVRAFLMQNLDGEPGSYRWRPNLAALAAHMDEILDFPAMGEARFSGPSLFLAGGDSDYVRPQDEPAIRAMFPQSQVRRIPGAGHWLHADKPVDFADAVMEFITRQEG